MIDAKKTVEGLRLLVEDKSAPLDHRVLTDAADAIESMSKTISEAADLRHEYLASWCRWVVDWGDSDVAEWLRVYGSEQVAGNPDAVTPEDSRRVQMIYDEVRAKCLQAARVIEALREEHEQMRQLAKERAAYRVELDRVIPQRDEARREVCKLLSLLSDGLLGLGWRRMRPIDIAEARGWNCYQGESNG